MTRTPVVFIHGLWLHATSWAPWAELFSEAGYDPIAPGWPGDPDTVAAARANPDSIADHGIDDVTRHYQAIIDTLAARPILIGHSFGGMIAEKLLGLDYGAAAIGIDAAQIKGGAPAAPVGARGGPERLVYEEAPVPVPGPGEALVAVHATAITFAELTWDLSWTTKDGRDRTPVIPAHEVSGTVAGLADGASGVAVGDEVYGLIDFDRDGAAAEFTTVPAAGLAAKPRAASHAEPSASAPSGRDETGLPARPDALEPGFHSVPAKLRARECDADGVSVN